MYLFSDIINCGVFIKKNELKEKLSAIKLDRLSPKQSKVVVPLLNIIEELNSALLNLQQKFQELRDENNRLKGEQGKPDIKPDTKKLQSKKGHIL